MLYVAANPDSLQKVRLVTDMVVAAGGTRKKGREPTGDMERKLQSLLENLEGN
jgi:hypothetical protein